MSCLAVCYMLIGFGFGSYYLFFEATAFDGKNMVESFLWFLAWPLVIASKTVDWWDR